MINLILSFSVFWQFWKVCKQSQCPNQFRFLIKPLFGLSLNVIRISILLNQTQNRSLKSTSMAIHQGITDHWTMSRSWSECQHLVDTVKFLENWKIFLHLVVDFRKTFHSPKNQKEIYSFGKYFDILLIDFNTFFDLISLKSLFRSKVVQRSLLLNFCVQLWAKLFDCRKVCGPIFLNKLIQKQICCCFIQSLIPKRFQNLRLSNIFLPNSFVGFGDCKC